MMKHDILNPQELAWICEQAWARSEANEVEKETEGALGCSGDAAIR